MNSGIKDYGLIPFYKCNSIGLSAAKWVSLKDVYLERS